MTASRKGIAQGLVSSPTLLGKGDGVLHTASIFEKVSTQHLIHDTQPFSFIYHVLSSSAGKTLY